MFEQHVRKESEHIIGKVPAKGNVCTCKVSTRTRWILVGSLYLNDSGSGTPTFTRGFPKSCVDYDSL